MSLKDSLDAVTAPVSKNRVDLLLDTLEGEDLATLNSALRNGDIRPFMLTKALRKEYGHAVVTDHSVGEWRRRNSTELLGN
jgi:hypothetical protein